MACPVLPLMAALQELSQLFQLPSDIDLKVLLSPRTQGGSYCWAQGESRAALAEPVCLFMSTIAPERKSCILRFVITIC